MEKDGQCHQTKLTEWGYTFDVSFKYGDLVAFKTGMVKIPVFSPSEFERSTSGIRLDERLNWQNLDT